MPMKPLYVPIAALLYLFSDPRESKDLMDGDVVIQQVSAGGCAIVGCHTSRLA